MTRETSYYLNAPIWKKGYVFLEVFFPVENILMPIQGGLGIFEFHACLTTASIRQEECARTFLWVWILSAFLYKKNWLPSLYRKNNNMFTLSDSHKFNHFEFVPRARGPKTSISWQLKKYCGTIRAVRLESWHFSLTRTSVIIIFWPFLIGLSQKPPKNRQYFHWKHQYK